MPTQIATDPALLQRLAAAARRSLSARERQAQRISFIYGSLPDDSTVTREQIRETLEQIDG